MLNDAITTVFAAGAGVLPVVLVWQANAMIRARARARTSPHADFFDDCEPLFDAVKVSPAEVGSARMVGRYHGVSVDLQAVAESTDRRAPAVLWLMVTIPAPMPVRARLHLRMHSSGLIGASRFAELPVDVAPPPGFPAGLSLRADRKDAQVPRQVLRRHLDFFASDRAAEMVISPQGLGLVWRAEGADLGRGQTTGDGKQAHVLLAPAALQPLLDRLLALRSDLTLQETSGQFGSPLPI